jgi:hypothetical protein
MMKIAGLLIPEGELITEGYGVCKGLASLSVVYPAPHMNCHRQVRYGNES